MEEEMEQAPSSMEANGQPENDADLDETEKVFSNSKTGGGWRAASMDLKGHLFYMLDNSIMSDMTFLVGESKDAVPAHRFLLVLWSKVFEEMPDTVEIPEMNVAALRSFLKVCVGSNRIGVFVGPKVLRNTHIHVLSYCMVGAVLVHGGV
jgi:hypothetical protein